MRAVIQRVTEASVTVDGAVVGSIGPGLLVLLGIAPEDGPDAVEWMVRKIARLRIFPDEAGRMNRAVTEVGGGVLVVSQFTLLADAAGGNRPSFTAAAAPEVAEPRCDQVVAGLRAIPGLTVATGRFRADMRVALVNDGPVTIVLDGPARK